MHRRFLSSLILALAVLAAAPSARADEVDDQLATISRSGPQAAGSSAARIAADELQARGIEILPRLLTAMDTGNPVAANWYRTVYDAIVGEELAQPQPAFPRDQLKQLVADAKRSPRVRRLVLALCERLEPGYARQVVPRMLDDAEFREDAVDAALVAGQAALEAGDSETAREQFEKAFDHSRDSSQTVRAADRLTALGQAVDIAAHLGLVVDWWLVGPFDAPQFSGFARDYPPQTKVDLQARYTGADGGEIGWLRHRASDPLGLINLVQALGPVKEAVGYAYSELVSPADLAGQLRCGADDNCTVWLNGKQVFGREQWLNGTRFDRFTLPIQLQAGTNKLLVKVCQGPPNKDPQVSNNWSLQLRFCDESGRGLPLRSGLKDAGGPNP